MGTTSDSSRVPRGVTAASQRGEACATGSGRACPNCSATLTGHSCKLRCPRCSYFESCSDLEAFPTDFGPRPRVVRPVKG